MNGRGVAAGAGSARRTPVLRSGHWHSRCPSRDTAANGARWAPPRHTGLSFMFFQKELCVSGLSLQTLQASRSEMQMRLQPKAIF